MIVIGTCPEGGGIAVQRVAGRETLMASSREPQCLTWTGWELTSNPWPIYQRTDPYRIMETCFRVFLYECAKHDGSQYILPTPEIVTAVFNGTTAGEEQSPWVTSCWDYYTEVVDDYDRHYRWETATAGDFAFTGARLYDLAVATHGEECFNALIPPNMPHPLAVFGVAYRRVTKKVVPGGSPSPKDSQPANRKLVMTAYVCNVAEECA